MEFRKEEKDRRGIEREKENIKLRDKEEEKEWEEGL